MRRSILGAVALSCAAAATVYAQSTSMRLFHPQTGYDEVRLQGISADGATASGYVRRDDYFTTTIIAWADGSRETWGLPSWSNLSISLGVSGDGSTLVGWAFPTPDNHSGAYRRTGAGPVQHLPLVPGYPRGQSTAASHDGSVIVGYGLGDAADPNASRAFIWTESAGLRSIDPFLPGGRQSEATAVSGDGRIVVGSATFSSYQKRAFMWTQAGGIVGLADIPGSPFPAQSRAGAITADGRVIAGSAMNNLNDHRLVRWDDGAITVLGRLPEYNFIAAHDISDDGSVIVGVGRPFENSLTSEAIIWTASTGVVRIGDYFRNNGFEEIPNDWFFEDVRGVSADGRTFAGTVRSSTFGPSGYIITVPGPATATLALLACGSTFRRRRTVEAERS